MFLLLLRYTNFSMPLFNFYCIKCNLKIRKLLKSFKETSCHNCGNLLEREATGPSYAVKELVDSGLMPKAIERYSDIEEKIKERTEQSKKKDV